MADVKPATPSSDETAKERVALDLMKMIMLAENKSPGDESYDRKVDRRYLLELYSLCLRATGGFPS